VEEAAASATDFTPPPPLAKVKTEAAAALGASKSDDELTAEANKLFDEVDHTGDENLSQKELADWSTANHEHPFGMAFAGTKKQRKEKVNKFALKYCGVDGRKKKKGDHKTMHFSRKDFVAGYVAVVGSAIVISPVASPEVSPSGGAPAVVDLKLEESAAAKKRAEQDDMERSAALAAAEAEAARKEEVRAAKAAAEAERRAEEEELEREAEREAAEAAAEEEKLAAEAAAKVVPVKSEAELNAEAEGIFTDMDKSGDGNIGQKEVNEWSVAHGDTVFGKYFDGTKKQRKNKVFEWCQQWCGSDGKKKKKGDHKTMDVSKDDFVRGYLAVVQAASS